MMEKWYTANDLAGLPGMPQTISGVIRKAKTSRYIARTRLSQGGGYEYHLSCFPLITKDYLSMLATKNKQEIEHPITDLTVTETNANVDLTTLKKWQRDIFNARVVLYREFERLIGVYGTTRACERMVAMAKYEELPEHLQRLVPIANARRGKNGRTLSKSTLMRWLTVVREQGITGLAPQGMENNDVPDWVPYFLKCYQRPQKPSIASAIEDMRHILPANIPMPSYSQVTRFQKKRSAIDKARGRHTAQAMQQFKGFVRRSDKNLLPLDIGQCDGHSFKARISHPEHGRPFHPEVCAIIDWKTRVCTGWSAWLSESSLTVSGAIIHSLQVNDNKPYGGTFAILYSDKGAGNTSHLVSDEVVGILARAGTQAESGRPGNPQGRGLIEKSNVSLWINAAKKLDTYTGKDMDKTAARKIYLVMDSEVKKTGTCTHEKLLSWDEFLRFCQQTVDDYNRRPHRALPKIDDPQTGRRRHMAPLEMWAQYLADGWRPSVLPPEIIDDLQNPQVQRKALRGEVSVLGNTYYNPALQDYHGHDVIVEIDVHNGREVKVRDIEHRLICRAQFERNVRDAFPVSFVEKSRQQRAKRRMALIDHKRDEIIAEEQGVVDLVPGAEILPFTPPSSNIEVDKAALKLEMQKRRDEITIPEDDKGKYLLWNKLDEMVKRDEGLGERELMFYATYPNSASYKAFRSVAERLGKQQQM